MRRLVVCFSLPVHAVGPVRSDGHHKPYFSDLYMTPSSLHSLNSANLAHKRWRTYLAYTTRIHLYIVDVHLPVVTKLKRAFALLLSEGICFIDFGILRKLTIRFYLYGSVSTGTQKIELHQLTVASLVRVIFHYDIRFAVLELT